MEELQGNLFTFECDARVIPTNCQVKNNGDAVMGAGLAAQAANDNPLLPGALGQALRNHGPRCVVIDHRYPATVAFPTKYDWRQPSNLDLIKSSAIGLATLAEHYEWRTIAIPRVGAGLGGLDWAQVQPILEQELDNRFILVTLS